MMPTSSSGIYRTMDRKSYGKGVRHLFEKEEKPIFGKGGSFLLGGVGGASSYPSVEEYRKNMGAGLKTKLASLKPKRSNIHFEC